MSPAETLDHLKSVAGPRMKKSLEAIYSICSERLATGALELSVADVANLGSGRGVPKAQSIRNSTGEPYRILIKSFQDSMTSKKNNRNVPGENWIAMIDNVRARFLVKAMEAENLKLKKLLRELVPPNLEIRVDDRTVFSKAHKLNEMERRALLYIISEEFRMEWKFAKGKHGDLLGVDGTQVFRPATFDAIEKALLYL
jgi:hypothetical protein